MNTNMKNVDTKSTKTNNYRRIGASLLVVVMAVGFSVTTFATKSEVNLAQKCYEYTGVDHPNDIQSTDINLYSAPLSTLNCGLTKVTLCGFCINTNDFPVDSEGMPILVDEFDQETDLGKVLRENRENYGKDGIEIVADNGKSVYIYFRP